ncbi:MAG: hypothetical protein A3H57_05155 [Candidatus Taylorbacteria bacterium RIFCSPLOWO2_02_FULL_43_11]|uniref:Uncharacterized protein n=1 Tax=Candidatus Taylorbacteria bacterium RIFCSPHIGHO2_02_FULL_43_32b TaxID=1802306 RepID=A0A1G2MIU4_9BACT|nr:MAG: hypothetical protein A2743_02365 [Candidatus Taylorbacteria bacterium RIFCSPHIGHO2_01_FULL_43_47]OHA23793.1 MAG: hypothetical protein A3C72_03640 [Candidatus Taylorbacteria bacterium RIFCSPHIGHO2_02_FULL_43_32b]OHA37141.1 MAG: hypothetical protein A3H57_05155 [Candidatus Taylorbacteria bacterium RIFCSPLOWO2_02_FULL_43_11]
MIEKIKQNAAVFLAFLIPILLILGIALSVYIPSIFLSTKYDFIYATCDDNRYSYRYDCANYFNNIFKVENGKLVEYPVDPLADSDKDGITDNKENYTARVFLHDTEKNVSSEITLEEAKQLNLRGLITSPDGVSVSNDYEYGAEFFPFFGTNSKHGYYLTKGKIKKKLDLINENDNYYYYGGNFKFLGWVI